MNRKLFVLLYLLIVPIMLLASEFVVSIWTIPVAHVTLYEHIDSSANHKEIVFSTYTKGLIGRLYPVQNEYRFLVNLDLGSLISYKKSIHQEDLIQSYSEKIKESSIVYSTGDTVLFSYPIYHMLTLIVGLQYDYININQPINVEHEGEMYTAYVTRNIYHSENDNLRLDIKVTKTGGLKVLEKTDIFSWKLTDEEATCFVILSKEDKKICGAGFSWKNMTLTAKRRK